MRHAIAKALSRSMQPFHTMDASLISDRLRKDLKQPCATISYLAGAKTGVRHLLQRASSIQEDDVVQVVEQNSALLGPLSLERSQHERARKKWDRNVAIAKLQAVHDQFSALLVTPTFNEDDARTLQSRIREVEERYRRAEERLTRELPRMARLQMSTIGSSHKLLSSTSSTEEANESDDDLMVDFQRLDLAESASSSSEKVIVIFDEAGCIPAYELLGLTRLESTIEALILVGDKEQLPPYQSSAISSSVHRRIQGNRYANRGHRDFARKKQPGIKSMLDCSRLSLDLGEKIKLTTQYRVPRDIAGILNDRVYNGDYKTDPSCGAPARGLHFVGVQADPEPRRKYVNKYEVKEVLDIIWRHREEQVMVVTPVRLSNVVRCKRA